MGSGTSTVAEEAGTTMTQHLTMSLQAVGQGNSGGDSGEQPAMTLPCPHQAPNAEEGRSLEVLDVIIRHPELKHKAK